LRTIIHDEVDRARLVGPAALLDHADSRLCALGLSTRGAFITAFSGSLDAATGEFRYSCAGHPPPRIVPARDRSVIALTGARAVPLGVLDERPKRTEASVVLEPGDLIVIYSDGITEARSPAGEYFGEGRLDSALRELPEYPLPEMAIDAINEAVRGFAGVGPPCDDQTLLAVRWLPDRTGDCTGNPVPLPPDQATTVETRS
ncbi:MAG: PP2C family protein-serine/threonine phosphatase, partial [Phycisphaerales bacterium]